MRLIHLEVENFGIFTRRHFNFGDGRLALVYGANETGKSTLLQLLREVLFGFPHRDSIPLDTGQIVARATMKLSDDRLLAWHRNKKRITPLSGYLLEDGTLWEEPALLQLLGGASAELYEHVFAFSLSELQMGEQSLQAAKLSETLYGGGSGGLAAFRRIEAAIVDRLEKLYSPRGTVRSINMQIKKIRDCSKQLRDASIRPSAFEQQAHQCTQAQQHLLDCASRVQQLKQQLQQLERRAQILPARNRRELVAQQLAALPLPAAVKLEQVAQLSSAVEQLIAAEEQTAKLQTEQAARRERRGQIHIEPRLLEHSEQILRLYADLQRIAGCRRDHPLRSEEALALEKEIDRRLARWRSEWNQQFLRQLSLGQAELKNVREMAEQRNRLERKQSETNGAHRAQLQQIADAQARIAKLIVAEPDSGKISDLHSRSNQEELCERASAMAQQHLKCVSRELAECQAVLETLIAQGAPTKPQLYASRKARDEKWAEIKAIMASVSIDSLAPQLIHEYEALVHRCDELADRLQSAANDVAARESHLQREQLLRQELGTAQLIQRELEKIHQQLAQLQQQRTTWETHWRELLATWQLPEQWTPQVADEVLSELFELKERLHRADNLHQRVIEMRHEVEQFALATKQVCQDVAVDLLNIEPGTAVRSLYQRMAQMKADLQLSTELDQQLAKLDTQRINAIRRREELSAQLGPLQIQSADELPKWQVSLRQAHELWSELQSLDQLLLSLTKNISESIGDASQVDAADLSAECQRVRSALDEAETEHKQALENAVLLKNRLDGLDTQNRANELALELEQHRAELQSAVDEWAPLMLASALMTRCLERFERDRQPQLLQSASILFQQMTEGRYVEIRRRLGGEDSLLVKHLDGREKEPSQLSRGTREQLYLAIRLAYVLQYCEQAEPLPLVMDDVLVNFDSRRARGTLEVLQEVSKHVQILLMTCHEATARTMMQVLPHVTRIDLGEPLEEGEPRPTVVPPRKRQRLAPAAADRDVQRPLFEEG